jgi:hypothetical protein
MIQLDYETFIHYQKGEYTQGRKMIKGVFRLSKKKDEIVEQFECLNISDDAERSYKATLDYFNYTKRDCERKRIFIRAEWCKDVFDYDIFECPEELKGQLKIGDFFG